MYILRLANVLKKYELEGGKTKVVLNNISLMFPSKGLIGVIGKSGSGKSTLMNMISQLDKPNNGCIYFNNENVSKWSKERLIRYRNEDIGIVFQHYHLLENETALFNIMLPALIGGKKVKDAEIAAKNLLKNIDFKENLYYQKCKDLSGGEKERIAILRALINDPKIVLADEPTGALDTTNSLTVMKLFKEISKTRLVIMVSHNLNLVKEYADEIISIKDGRIEKIETINNIDDKVSDVSPYKSNHNKKWIAHLSRANFKRRFNRNLVSIASLVIGLVSTMLIFGFSNGSKASVKKSSYSQLDYGVSTLYKETTQNVPGSKMTLVQMSRPSYSDIYDVSALDYFYFEPNCDTLLNPYPKISSGETLLDELSYVPIYSYVNESLNAALLLKGKLPGEDSFEEVVINKKAYEYLKKTFNSEPIGLAFSIHYDYEYHYYTGELTNPVITDYFIFDKTTTIVGVVDDFNFLSTAKMYYPFVSLKDFLQETILVNLSSYLDERSTWYDQIMNSQGNDAITSYSYRLFLKDYRNSAKLEDIVNRINKPYKIESNSLTVGNTLLDLMNAATIGMEIFLVIAIIGTALILGIISFSSYSEDKKTSAILTCLGAKKKDIFTIYLNENILLGLISLVLSLVIAPLLMLGINELVRSLTSFANIIEIPFLSFLGIPILFPVLLYVSTLLICLFSTYIPLFFSKKISPKEELAEE